MGAAEPPRRLRRFAFGLAAAALAVLGATLWLGPSRALDSTGVVVILVLGWPILASIVSILLFGLLSLAPGGSDPGEAGEAGLTIGVEGGAWYYRLLLGVRSPVFWGSFLGAILGVGGLYLYVDRFVQPKEDEAEARVKALASALEAHRAEGGEEPATAAGGTLHEALGLAAGDRWKDASLLDPWDRPIRYTAGADREGGRFLVYSTGWDGEDEAGKGDDVAALGETRVEGLVRGLGRTIGNWFDDDEETEE